MSEQHATQVKLSAIVAPYHVDILRRIATDQGITMTEVLRQAILVMGLFHDEVKAGSRIVAHARKHDREIVLNGGK